MNLLFAGIEFKEEEAQISFYRPDMDEPDTVSILPGKEKYAIPLAVCRSANGSLYYGDAAAAKKRERNARYYDRLLSRALREKGTMYRQMLLSYIKYLLLFGRNYAEGKSPVFYLTITVPELTKEMAQLLLYIRDSLKIEPGHFRISDFQESYFDYIYMRGRSLWKQDALLYDFSDETVQVMILSKKNKSVPKKAYITTRVYKPDEKERKDPVLKDRFFAGVLQDSLKGRIANCIYLIGDGFDGDWLKESKKAFGTNKRVFIGRNLYSRGACLGGYRSFASSNDAVHFESRYRIPVTMGVHVLSGQKQIFLPIARAGTDWFNFEYKYELLYNGSTQLEVFFLNRTGDEVPVRTLQLEGFPESREKARSIQLYTRALDRTRLYICIKDLGFGEFTRAEAKTWTYEIPMEEERV